MRPRYSFSAKKTGKFRKSPFTNAHHKAFPKIVEELIENSDIILEVIDARFIDKTRNIVLEKVIREKGKKLVFILNKADIADVKEIKMNYNLSDIQPYILFSSKSSIGRARLRQLIKIEASRVKKKGDVKVGIIGYPNTGKSTLINTLSRGKKASTSALAGHTTGIQKIRISSNVLMIDSPGVLPIEEENSLNPEIVKRQIETSVKNYEKVKYPDFVVKDIMEENPSLLENHYEADSQGDVEILLENLGIRWKFLKKGGVVDQDRVARKILKDWKDGKIK